MDHESANHPLFSEDVCAHVCVCTWMYMSVCVCVLPVFSGQVEVCVDVQQDFFKEAQPLALGLLGEVEHLLHVLHVARVTAVQLLQGLCVALLHLPHTQHIISYCTTLHHSER